MSLQGKMFVPKIKGYHTEIIGDRQGEVHQVLVKDRIVKAKVYDMFCQGGVDHEGNPNAEVKFRIGGADAVSKSNAVTMACDRYRYVMGLKASDHVNCRVEEVRAEIGAKV